jgi:hypothetical protein
MTIRLPRELYERLRREAFEKRVSQASIVVDSLAERLGYVASEKEGQNGAQDQ